jgi:hypothetical protein
MAAIPSEFHIPGLARPKLAALRKKARKLGLSPEAYVRRLIDDDLELDHLAITRSMTELTTPFREAFKHTSEAEIGSLVEAARKRHRRKLSER